MWDPGVGSRRETVDDDGDDYGVGSKSGVQEWDPRVGSKSASTPQLNSRALNIYRASAHINARRTSGVALSSAAFARALRPCSPRSKAIRCSERCESAGLDSAAGDSAAGDSAGPAEEPAAFAGLAAAAPDASAVLPSSSSCGARCRTPCAELSSSCKQSERSGK